MPRRMVILVIVSAVVAVLATPVVVTALSTQGDASALPTGGRPDQAADVSPPLPTEIRSEGVDPNEARRQFLDAQGALMEVLGTLPRVGKTHLVVIGQSVLREHPGLLAILGEWHPDLGFYLMLDVRDAAFARTHAEVLDRLRGRNNIRSYADPAILLQQVKGWRVHEVVYLATPVEAKALRAAAGRGLRIDQAGYDGLAGLCQQVVASLRDRPVRQLSTDDLQRAQALARLAERL